MQDVLESAERAYRFVYGRPELVEAAIAQVIDTYACTNLFFYVVDNHLEVCATLINMKEIRKAQFMLGQIAPGVKLRPN